MSVLDGIKDIQIEEITLEGIKEIPYRDFKYFINSSDVLFRVFVINGEYYMIQEWALQSGMFDLLEQVSEEELLKGFTKLW